MAFPQIVCQQCGSKLVEIEKKVEKSQGQQSPITSIAYRCSKKDCQQNIDSKVAEMRARRKEQEENAAVKVQAAAAKKAAAAAEKPAEAVVVEEDEEEDDKKAK